MGMTAWISAVGAETASEDQINIYFLKIDTPTLSRGYTASVFNDNFRVGIFPEILNEETEIVFKEFENPAEILPLPDQAEKRIVSNIYEFDIKNQAAFYNEKPVIIEIKYPEDSNDLKKIYFWDKISGEWRELPSKSITERGVARAPLHLPYARLAIFENPNIMEVGVASWYAYRFCDCAASPDWPKGAKLKVTDLDDSDSIVVTVNDYGPDRSIHPDRVIDLDVVAFKKIAPKWLGLIKVKVEKL
jgi:rare lipoprotein A